MPDSFYQHFRSLIFYPQFALWVKDLWLHEGIYGQGAEGITTPALMTANFSVLFRDLPILFITIGIELVLILAAFLLLYKRETNQKGLWALVIGLVFQILLETVIIIKHPTDSYMLAVAASAPVLMMVILEILEVVPRVHRLLSRILIIAMLAGLGFSLYNSMIGHRNYADYVNNAVTETSQAIQEYSVLANRTPDTLSILWTYGTFSPCQSLKFGDNGTSHEVTNDIKRICGQQRTINIWSNNAGVLDRKWDLIVTRKNFLTTYPLLFNGIGVIYKQLPTTANEYGPIIVIANAK